MGSIRMFIGVFVIVGGIYVSIKVVPPYFNNYQFQDWIKQEATHDSYVAKSEGDIRQDVLKKSQEYDIPLTEEGIHVVRSGNQFSGNVSINAPYVIHVDLPGYPLDLHFNVSTENKGVF
jgi:YbbR domain-containing protein